MLPSGFQSRAARAIAASKSHSRRLLGWAHAQLQQAGQTGLEERMSRRAAGGGRRVQFRGSAAPEPRCILALPIDAGCKEASAPARHRQSPTPFLLTTTPRIIPPSRLRLRLRSVLPPCRRPSIPPTPCCGGCHSFIRVCHGQVSQSQRTPTI